MVSVYQNMAALSPQMRKPVKVKVYFYGHLRQFCRHAVLYAETPAAALTGVVHRHPGLEACLRRGRFVLYAGGIKRGRVLTARDVVVPLDAASLHLLPHAAGAARGRGKAVLGLTLLGLSIVPGVNTAIGSSFGQLGQHIGAGDAFQAFGNQLLGRVGSLMLLAGAAEALSPQPSAAAGRLPSSAQAAPETRGQGAAIPLVYGKARLDDPVVVSSGLDVVTRIEA